MLALKTRGSDEEITGQGIEESAKPRMRKGTEHAEYPANREHKMVPTEKTHRGLWWREKEAS